MAFKMKGYSPFTKETRLEGERNINENSNRVGDENWKENQSIMDDLKSLQADLKEAKTEEEKKDIQLDIDRTREIIDKGYDNSSQLNPNNPDKD